MGKLEIGSSGWVKSRARAIASDARALDCFAAARNGAAALLRHWDSPDAEVKSALHSAAVVNYARPFSDNPVYPIKRLKGHPGFDLTLHRHLVELRNKLIAHANSRYLESRVAYQRMELKVGGQNFQMIPGASVHVLIALAA